MPSDRSLSTWKTTTSSGHRHTKASVPSVPLSAILSGAIREYQSKDARETDNDNRHGMGGLMPLSRALTELGDLIVSSSWRIHRSGRVGDGKVHAGEERIRSPRLPVHRRG